MVSVRNILSVAVAAAVLVAISAAAQAPRKARPESAAPPRMGRFSGTIVELRGVALPGMGETVTAFYARRDEETKRFVVRLVEGAGEPRTPVLRSGRELTGDEVLDALNVEGLRVDVEHETEADQETGAYHAIKVTIGGFAMNADATGNPSDLQIDDIQVGDGREARPGDTVTVHYTGWLADGTQFDSSHDRRQPFTFRLGERQVIRGWDLGVDGMRVGGKRKLTIPPGLGYGARGAGRTIPPNSTLVFEVELLQVR